MKRFFTELILAAISIVTIIFLLNSLLKKNDEISRLENNQKALYSQIDSDKTTLISQKITIDELKKNDKILYDSISVLCKELKIKQKQVTVVEYIESGFSKTDTIFVEDISNIDTCYGNNWYEVCISLDTNKLTSTILANSALIVMYYNKKETIKPKKCIPLCWFQKKHWVTNIKLNEKNPYINVDSARIIELYENKK